MAETSEKSFPFDADEVLGGYDRAYLADDFAMYFRAFISSGTFMKQSTNLQVMANGDMTVTLKAGSMIIDGYRYENESDIVISLSPADGVLDRIDRISITWSKEDRDIHYTVQKGTSSYQPYAPECRRTADYKDYVVADVYIGAGAISIKQEDITDTRLNSELCGLAIAFSDIDTTTIFNQFESWFQETKETGEQSCDKMMIQFKQDIMTWFDNMKDQLSEDAAIKLQLQINAIKAETQEISEEEIYAIIDGSYADTGDENISETYRGEKGGSAL